MIIPWLNFILPPRQAPITWTLLLLNFAIFVFTQSPRDNIERALNKYYRDAHFLNTQGAIYAKFITRNPASYSDLTQEKAHQALTGDRKSLQTMAGYALRDTYFLESAVTLPLSGDAVAMEMWREKILRLRSLQKIHPDSELAFTSSNPTWMQALTYQFTHGNLWHLISNAAFLLFLGSYLEPLIGSGAFLLSFLISGVLGALIYAIIGGASAIPMIGASGSVSGMFGLLGAHLWRRPVRFFYFIMPADGYWGFVYLPAWIILVHRFVLDMTGYFSTVEEIGSSVAFTTHLGGLVAGILLALLVFRRSEATT
jgi:membrane associated rhomboid family serine protease